MKRLGYFVVGLGEIVKDFGEVVMDTGFRLVRRGAK